MHKCKFKESSRCLDLLKDNGNNFYCRRCMGRIEYCDIDNKILLKLKNK